MHENQGATATKKELTNNLVAAGAHASEFMPIKGVDYDWVMKCVVDYYNAVEKDFDIVDGKAQALIAYFGAGTSVLAVAVTMALSEHKLSRDVAMAFSPSIISAIIAILIAAYTRRPLPLKHAPSLKGCKKYIDHFLGEKTEDGKRAYTEAEASKMAEYFSIAQWYDSAVHNCRVVENKSYWCNVAMFATVISVGCLIIPYITILCK